MRVFKEFLGGKVFMGFVLNCAVSTGGVSATKGTIIAVYARPI